MSLTHRLRASDPAALARERGQSWSPGFAASSGQREEPGSGRGSDAKAWQHWDARAVLEAPGVEFAGVFFSFFDFAKLWKLSPEFENLSVLRRRAPTFAITLPIACGPS